MVECILSHEYLSFVFCSWAHINKVALPDSCFPYNSQLYQGILSASALLTTMYFDCKYLQNLLRTPQLNGLGKCNHPHMHSLSSGEILIQSLHQVVVSHLLLHSALGVICTLNPGGWACNWLRLPVGSNDHGQDGCSTFKDKIKCPHF